jgi:hypothetical protein
MDWFYWAHESATAPHRIESEGDYRREFPEGCRAIERAFGHKFSAAKKEDYQFSRFERANSRNALHRVVYERKQTTQHGFDMMPISFEVFFRHAERIVSQEDNRVTVERKEWWETDPAFADAGGGKWGD